MRALLIILIVLGSVFEANALRPPSSSNEAPQDKPLGGSSDVYTKANCPPSDAKLFLQFNDVRALVEAGGSLWQNRQDGSASYEVPLGGGNHVIYSGSIRSEEHTSELQSRPRIVCRLLLEIKN